ncbi:MAG: hypothetical protein DRO00_05945 [Thermoproteota archaeon]|nr:MAG: hypothetical protein DRO00_05945 [Candidatus Korarchaeota archaeon]
MSLDRDLETKEKYTIQILEELPNWLSEPLKNYFVEKGLSPHTKFVYAQASKRYSSIVGKPPLQANRNQVRDFFRGMLSEIGRSSASLYFNRFRSFVRWLNGGELPKAWDLVIKEKRETNLRDKILSPEEIKALIKGCRNTKSKAIIALLYESAIRAGELCSLRIKDLEFTDYGIRIRIRGKTGERVIPLHDSVPYLRAWLQIHPDPKPESWLFPGRNGVKMSGKAVVTLVKRAGERAGIKRIHPHMLRHTRLTELAKKLTEQELKLFAGWTRDSRMASIYVHLSGRDVENAVLGKVLGMKEIKEEEERALEPRVCPECGFLNPSDSMFCLKCGYPLTEEAREKIRPIEETIDELMERVLKSKKARQLFRKALEVVLEEEGEKVE